MKKKVFLMIIFVIIFVCGCSNSNNSMTKIDKEFNEYANEAAEKFLKNEADEYTWTNVKTGELEYRYTFYKEKFGLSNIRI